MYRKRREEEEKRGDFRLRDLIAKTTVYADIRLSFCWDAVLFDLCLLDIDWILETKRLILLFSLHFTLSYLLLLSSSLQFLVDIESID